MKDSIHPNFRAVIDNMTEEQKEAISKKLAELPKVSYEEIQQRLKDAFNLPHPSATISGWVARDKDKHLMLHQVCPQRVLFVDGFPPEEGSIDLPQNLFPSLTWQDDPIEVEITIKPKKR